MTTAADLLPSNSGTFEKLLAKALLDDLPVPLRDLVDPYRTPARFLPFLAAHHGVDLWFEDWPEARKRLMVDRAPALAALKGTRAGQAAFLAFVDGTILDRIAYPARFILGRSRIARTPIGHPAHVARYLVKVATTRPAGALVLGRSALGRARLKTPTREPLRRCLVAMTAAKAPETEIRVDFTHKRLITLDDAPPIDGSIRLGQYVDRVRL